MAVGVMCIPLTEMCVSHRTSVPSLGSVDGSPRVIFASLETLLYLWLGAGDWVSWDHRR